MFLRMKFSAECQLKRFLKEVNLNKKTDSKGKVMKKSLRERNDRDLFNNIAAAYAKKDFTPSSLIARRYQFFSAYSLLQSKAKWGTIVDIGCGVGTPCEYLRGKYKSYLGIDQSEKEIDLAKCFFKKNRRARFVTQSINDIKNVKGDLIISLGALHHMVDLKKVFQTLQRIAQPGAQILIVEPYKGNLLINFARKLRKIIDKSYSKDQVFFQEKELLDIFKSNQMQNIKVDFQGFLTPLFAQIIISPQAISKYLSIFSTKIDRLINHFPLKVKKYLAANIIIIANFPK